MVWGPIPSIWWLLACLLCIRPTDQEEGPRRLLGIFEGPGLEGGIIHFLMLGHMALHPLPGKAGYNRTCWITQLLRRKQGWGRCYCSLLLEFKQVQTKNNQEELFYSLIFYIIKSLLTKDVEIVTVG